MAPESVILLAVSAWFLVAAAMLWGMLRIVRRHARDASPVQPPRTATPVPRKAQRHRPPRPALTPAYRAAQHFAHR